jgi:lysozyme
MPPTNAAGLSLLKGFETCVLYAYDDADTSWPRRRIMPGDTVIGTLTIGWGHTGDDVKPGLLWTQAQADAALAYDLHAVEAFVNDHIAHDLTPDQFSALVCFTYNVGDQAFADSTLLRLLNQGDVAGAAAQFGRWVKAGGAVVAGLVRRRAAEASLFQGSILA